MEYLMILYKYVKQNKDNCQSIKKNQEQVQLNDFYINQLQGYLIYQKLYTFNNNICFI